MHVQTLNDNKISKSIFIILLLLAFSIPLSTSMTSILSLIFMLLWIIEGDFSAKITYIWQNKACFSSILVLVSLMIGALYSSANFEEILFYLKKMSKLIYLPFFISYFNNPKQRQWTINSLIIAGIFTATIGLIYYKANPFKNTIDTSLIITTTTFLLMHKLDIKNKLHINAAIILSISINVFYLFYISAGRTSQLIFLLLIPIFFIQKINLTQKKSTTVTIAIISILMVIITITFCGLFSKPLINNWSRIIHQYNDYQTNPTSYDQNSISQRLVYYKNTFNLIKEKPLLGWGTGSFPIVYKNFIIKHNLFTTNKHEYSYTTNPHNEYLLFGTQLGICGIGLLLWLFYVLFNASFIIQSYEKYILQGIIIIISIGCLTNSWLMDFTSGYLFIILTAISLGALPHARIIRNNGTV